MSATVRRARCERCGPQAACGDVIKRTRVTESCVSSVLYVHAQLRERVCREREREREREENVSAERERERDEEKAGCFSLLVVFIGVLILKWPCRMHGVIETSATLWARVSRLGLVVRTALGWY